MRVVFLGTGTSHGVPMIGCDCAVCLSDDPRDKRMRTSIVLELEGGVTVLVDTPPDLRSQALKYGLRRVDVVVYTHSHIDHLVGLDEIRRFNVLSGLPVPVYADETTLADVRRVFNYAFEPDAPRGGGVPDLRLWTIGGPFCIAGDEVVPVPVRHGTRMILGFRVGRFAYLTDCNGVPDESLALLGGLDVLAIDALRHTSHPTHFTLSEAVEMARRIGARQTYFTHMAHDLGHEATCAQLPAGMALAYDGLSFELTR